MNALTKALVTLAAMVAVALACIGCGASPTNVGVVQTPATTPKPASSANGAPTPSFAPTVAWPPLRTPEPRDQSKHLVRRAGRMGG